MRTTLMMGALAVAVLSGCNNGQPKLWRVAIDATPVRSITEPACFRGSILPASRGQLQEQSFRQETEWVIWDGVEGKQYLDMGTVAFDLGDAPRVCVNDLIEGQDKVFSAQRTEQRQYGSTPVCKRDDFRAGSQRDGSENRVTQIVVSWNDEGISPTGTVQLSARYACINGPKDMCPTNVNETSTDSVSCQATLNFVARRIEWQQTTSYTNNAK